VSPKDKKEEEERKAHKYLIQERGKCSRKLRRARNIRNNDVRTGKQG